MKQRVEILITLIVENKITKKRIDMEKLNITNSAKHQFKMLGIDCINNARGAVYLQGSMRSVTMAISKLLVLNPGVRVKSMNTATVKIVGSGDENFAIVDACVIFEDINPETEDE